MSAARFSHLAYGLNLESDIFLPELMTLTRKSDTQTDVVVNIGSNTEPHLPDGESSQFQLENATAHLKWRDVGSFVVRNGNEILIEPAPAVADSTLRAFLLGPVLAILLQQRGFLVLHASAAARQKRDGSWSAVGFLGVSGEGKSTMVAMLHANGYHILADDIIAVPVNRSCDDSETQPANGHIQVARKAPLIAPGFPQLRLSAASVVAAGHDPQLLPLRASRERHVLPVQKGFVQQSVPLHSLYVLESGDCLRSRLLSPAQAVIHLARHSYVAGSLLPADQAAHFQQCAAVANCVHCYRLQRPRDLSLLNQNIQLIENDAQNVV